LTFIDQPTSRAVLVERIESYSDEAAIKAFVRRSFELDPEIPEFIRSGPPGRLIVLKPNWVQESHGREPDVWVPVITHPVLVLAVAEYVAELAVRNATISICDAPHTNADFSAIVKRGGFLDRLRDLAKRYPELSFELLDLRREVWQCQDGVVVSRRPSDADPRGYVRVNLGRESLLYGFAGEGKYYGADYDTETVNRHHRGEIQEYLIAGTPMRADVFVNLAKMKTHTKTGISCCLKNLVGVNGDKNWLPHYVEGTPRFAGDEYPHDSLGNHVERLLKRHGRSWALARPNTCGWIYGKMRAVGMFALGTSQETVRNGNWGGNDTCWRMALDLNRAFYYANGRGRLGSDRRRRALNILDGIVAGEGNGPLCPSAVHSGAIIAGVDPAEVDATAAALMGFDPHALPIVDKAIALRARGPWPQSLVGREFAPPLGWAERLQCPRGTK